MRLNSPSANTLFFYEQFVNQLVNFAPVLLHLNNAEEGKMQGAKKKGYQHADLVKMVK